MELLRPAAADGDPLDGLCAGHCHPAVTNRPALVKFVRPWAAGGDDHCIAASRWSGVPRTCWEPPQGRTGRPGLSACWLLRCCKAGWAPDFTSSSRPPPKLRLQFVSSSGRAMRLFWVAVRSNGRCRHHSHRGTGEVLPAGMAVRCRTARLVSRLHLCCQERIPRPKNTWTTHAKLQHVPAGLIAFP